MNALQIVEEYLKANGFDGLWNDSECGCSVDDLAPCNESFSRCKPGHLIEVDEDGFDIIGERSEEK